MRRRRAINLESKSAGTAWCPKRLLISIAAMCAVLALLLYFSDLPTLLGYLRNISVRYVLLCVPALVASWALRGRRWQITARHVGTEVGILDAVALATASNFANLLVPARVGDLLWINGAKERCHVGYGAGLISVGFCRLAELVMIVVFLAITSALVVSDALQARAITYIASAAGMLLVLYAIYHVGLRRNKFLLLLRGPLARLRRIYQSLRRILLMLVSSKLLLVHVMIISVGVWIADIAVFVLMCTMLGIHPGLAVMVFACSLGALTKIVPLTPAGIGTFEAASTLILTSAGVEYDAALGATLISHAVANAGAFLLGLAALGYLGLDIFRVDVREIAQKSREYLAEPSEPC
jgi:hypothetical protein